MTRLVCLLAVALSAGACSDFRTPAELAKPQIVGLRVDPAVVAPGQRARLTALVAGPDGPMVVATRWSVAPGNGSSVEVDDDGAWLRIPGDSEEGSFELYADVDLADATLSAVRSVRVASKEHINPSITGLYVDGELVEPEQLVRLTTDQLAELDVVTEPVRTDETLVSWYATTGEIELYRRAPTELLAPADVDDGWLLVVVRDGRGGIAWASYQLVID